MQRREQSKAAGLPEAGEWMQARQLLALRRCKHTAETKSTFVGKWGNHQGRKSRQGSQERRCVTSVTTMGASTYFAGKFWEAALTLRTGSHTLQSPHKTEAAGMSLHQLLSASEGEQLKSQIDLTYFFFLACLHKPWCRRLPWTKMPRDWQTGSPLGSKSQEIQVAHLFAASSTVGLEVTFWTQWEKLVSREIFAWY